MTLQHLQESLAAGQPYYILEHRTESKYRRAGEREAIRLDQIELGRDPRCRIRFEDSFTTVSRRHAAIVKEGDRWKLIRISDINPTLVNGNVVSNQWYLQDDDEIELSAGGPRLGFIIPPPPAVKADPPKPSHSRSFHGSRHLDMIERQLVTLFRRTNIAIAFALITLIAVIAGLSILTGLDRSHTRFVNETRTETAGIKQSIESVNLGLDEVRNDLDIIKGRQDELERLVNRYDDALTQRMKANAGVMNSRIAQSESRISENIAGIRREIFSQRRATSVRPPAVIPSAPTTNKQNNGNKESKESNDGRTVKAAAEPSFGSCIPYIYYIHLDRIETISAKNDFRIFKTDKMSWAGTGFLLRDGRFITSRSVIERWKFLEHLDLSALNAIAEKGGRITACFTATSAAGGSFSFTGNMFTVDRSADSFNPGRKQTVASSFADKDIAVMQTQQRGGLQFAARPPAGTRIYAHGFPSQPGLNPAVSMLSGSGVTTSGSLRNGLIPVGSDDFLQLGSGSPVFSVTPLGEPEVVGVLTVSQADARRLIIPLPALPDNK